MDLEAFFHEYKEKKNAYQMALSTCLLYTSDAADE